MLKVLISETQAMKEVIESGAKIVHDAEISAKEARTRNAGGVDVGGSPPAHTATTSRVQTNPFGSDATTGAADAYSVASSYYGGQSQASNLQPHTIAAASTPQRSVSSVTHFSQGHPTPAQNSIGASEEALRKLEQLKQEAERAEAEAMSADDHAQALGVRFEDVKAEAEDANALVNEKNNAKKKKKGFLRGGGDKTSVG